MNKKSKALVAIYAIVLIVYVVLFFIIPFPKGGASWVEFTFTIVSIIFGLTVTYYALRKGETLKSKVYGFAVFRIGAIYTIAQLCVGIIVCVVGIFAAVPVWISAVISVILLALAAIGIIASDNVRDVIEEQEYRDTISTKPMTYFRLDIQSIVDLCSDTELKKRLEKLNESFKYSDPVSSDSLKAIEDKIHGKIQDLYSVINSDSSAAAEITGNIELLLDDRNRRCKALKQN